MSEYFKDFQKKFLISELGIKTIGSWILTIRPQQPTPGSMVLSLDRPCELLSGLTEKEGADLAKAFRFIGEILKKAFKPDKINYLGLMMVDRHAHFHVIPRYSKSVKINGKHITDDFWPASPGLQPLKLSSEDLKVIYDKLIEASLSIT